MILNFQIEAAKRRDRTGQAHSSLAGRHIDMRLPTANWNVRQVEFGSGWYHSDAVKSAAYIQSHRD